MTTQQSAGQLNVNRRGGTTSTLPTLSLAPSIGSLTDAILATVAYYDIFERPLTPGEIAERLIGQAGNEAAVAAELSSSPRLRAALACADGHCVLAHRTDLVPLYLSRASARERKWRRVQGFGRVACHVPFVRALIVGGSLAIGSARGQSDLDVCLLVAEGRLWIARGCLWVLRVLWNVARRRPLVTPKQDKLDILAAYAPPAYTCHNQSLYAALLLRDGLVLYDEDAIVSQVSQYAAANDWVLTYCPGFTRLALAPTPIRPPRLTVNLKRVSERILSARPFDLAEHTVYRWWRHRWHRFATATDRPWRSVVATPHASDLYSYYWEEHILAQYRERLAALGLLSSSQAPG